MTMETVTVDAKALRQVLNALLGPAHYIRELQALMNPPFNEDNPICILIKQFNEAVEAFGKPETKE